MIEERNYKIVYCAPALYSAGGVERVVSLKASYFAEVFGYDVTIIVTEGQGRACFFPLSNKVRVINLQLGFEDLWRVSFIKKILLYLKKQRQYKKLLSTELMRIRPDITISVLRREINFINSIPDGSRKIGELHVNRSNYRNFIGQDSNFIKCVFSRYWMNNLVKHLKRLDRMVVLTATAQNDWPELSNVTLIPDPLPFKVENVSSLTTKRVICIGRYAYEKGIDLLLRVWAKVQDRGHDWVLDIYGVGDQTSYRHLFQELGIDDRRCHLYDSLTDVQNAYLNSSIFVLPSRFEGFSMVIIEAMSCGVPVVSFDCENGPRNIITNGQNGFLVPPFDIDVYAERLLTLMQNDKLRQSMGLRARQTSYQYQIEDIALRWKALFDEVVTGQ
jgi:glycosyltransferase involved in cell wall biosynthesis